jgi:hypothetical protein
MRKGCWDGEGDRGVNSLGMGGIGGGRTKLTKRKIEGPDEKRDESIRGIKCRVVLHSAVHTLGCLAHA